MVSLTRTWRVASLLFGSGFCALVYQICWLREFRLVFGASTAASAAVLAIFTAGLGIGGLVLGAGADKRRHPLRFYAALEAVIALAAAASPFLLAIVRSIYIWSGGSARLGAPMATGMRLALCSLVLALPTIAMGGTLPAAARAATQAGDRRGHAVAVLYALNTLGAVAGTLLSTFVLLERIGTRGTLWLAAAINLVIAIVAALDRSTDALSQETPSTDDDAAASLLATNDANRVAPTPFLLVASGTLGFAFFLMELVWYRLLAPLLGGSVFTFGLVLAVALLGIGLGGLGYAIGSRRYQATLSAFATTCLLEAICVAGTFALGDRIAMLALRLQPPVTAGFVANLTGWALVAALVVLPPAVVAGFQFPLLIALFGRGRARLGREVGRACAANTVGAIGGSLAGGFGLLPWLTAPGAWRFVGIVLVLLGILAATLGGSARRWHLGFAHVIMATAGIGLLFAAGPGPVWRHSGIGARRAPAHVLDSPNNLRAWQTNARNAVMWEGDGVESAVALALDVSGYAFVVNGKADGSARGDAGTQVMLGLLAALKHPQPQRALVIGLGTGSSAGWLASVPSVEHVDVVELEPLILNVALACSAVNHDAMTNPKMSIAIGDAREALLTGRGRYDIIASEPSNPFRAGVASLFTREFYDAVSQRLTSDGVFAQWVQAYEIDGRTLATIYATMHSVFAEVETWETQRGDFVLLGTSRKRPYPFETLVRRISEEPYRSAIYNAWRAVDIHGVLAHYVGDDALARAVPAMASAVVNTDDRNIVEFGLARSVGRQINLAADVRALAHRSGAQRPLIDGGEGIRWPAVDTAWVSYSTEQGGRADVPVGPSTEEQRREALRRYFERNDATGAHLSWSAQTDGPRDLNELAMLADAEAASGNDAALPLIERLRAYQPGEAATLLASLRFRQARLEEAAAATIEAFARFRVSPWTATRYARRALDNARRAPFSPPLTRQVFDALEQPFANLAVNEQRLTARVELALKLSQSNACVPALSAFGQRMPWTERFLRSQRDCYEMNGDPRLAAASRDLIEFRQSDPPSIPLNITRQ